VVGGSGREITPQNQWSQFFEVGARLYARYLSYDYFLKGRPLSEGRGLRALDVLVEDSTHKVFEHLIEKKANKLISFQELSNVIHGLDRAGFLPKSISANSFNELIPVLVQKILLPPESRLAGEIPHGLGLIATNELRLLYADWSQNQKFIDLIYQGLSANSGKTASEILEAINLAEPTNELMEMKMILTSPLTLSFDALGRIQFSQPPPKYRKSNATVINTVRAAVQTAIRSYAMDLNRIRRYEGITNAEANALYKDIKSFVVEMGMISPENIKFADSRFRDANLFTSVGNGDELADFREFSNLAILILSGIKVDSMIYQKLEKACLISKPTSQKYDWTVNVDCAKHVYRSEIPVTFNSMPEFIQFHEALTDAQFDQMYSNLLKAIEAKVDGNGQLNIGDLGLYAHVVQYIEGLYQQYDLNHNGTLETAEAMEAYPRYRSILLKVSSLTKENELRGLFAWLLKKGKPPTGLAEQANFKLVWCKQEEEKWAVAADRAMLATILGFIADAMATHPSPVIEFFQ
jgi:hypothetical protein